MPFMAPGSSVHSLCSSIHCTQSQRRLEAITCANSGMQLAMLAVM